jgi:hypothetical protein
VLMGANDRGVDDQILEVRIIGHRLEDAPPDALVAPSAEAAEDAVPIAEPSGRSRHGEPVRTIHKTASTNIRLSRPDEPRVRLSPMMWADIRSH